MIFLNIAKYKITFESKMTKSQLLRQTIISKFTVNTCDKMFVILQLTTLQVHWNK